MWPKQPHTLRKRCRDMHVSPGFTFNFCSSSKESWITWIIFKIMNDVKWHRNQGPHESYVVGGWIKGGGHKGHSIECNHRLNEWMTWLVVGEILISKQILPDQSVRRRNKQLISCGFQLDCNSISERWNNRGRREGGRESGSVQYVTSPLTRRQTTDRS